jgi:ferrous iron transport protein A
LKTVVLTALKTGERALISNIIRGRGVQQRLMDLGLIPGTSIEVISHHPFGGPILLKVGSSHVALGRGVAKAIEVEKLN